jgi:CheY-like chemotaxis protein
MHDGTIAASSDGEGQGSLFTIRLPRISSGATTARVQRPIERRARPRRVLLIEDDADAREMLRMMLEIAGHAVYVARDGESGLELLEIVRPDVAIIDIGLPRMDGYEVARRIRQQYGNTMLLLALTGYSAAADVDRALAHGFNHHLVKPVDTDQLAQLLDRTNRPIFVSDQGLERTIVP